MEQMGALFLDRDGVIVEDVGYLSQEANIKLIDDIIPSLQWATERNIPIVVITNQSGVARGYFSLAEAELINQKIDQRLSALNIQVRDWFICPHHPTISGECSCRKPAAGLLWQAKEKYNISLEHSMMVGDKCSDVFEQVDLHTFLVAGSYPLDRCRELERVTVGTHAQLLSFVQSFFSRRLT